MRQKIYPKNHKQKGMTTLAISLLMLFLVTLVTLYTANTSLVEQKVTNNQYRAEQAMSTAQAGMDVALERHNTFDSDDTNYLDPDDIANTLTKGGYSVVFCDVWDEGDIDPVTGEHSQSIDFDDGGSGATSDSLLAAFESDFATALTATTLDAASICTNPLNIAGEGEDREVDTATGAVKVADGFWSDERVGIIAIGESDDASGRHVISLVSAGAPLLQPDGGPFQPVVARGSVAISGNISVINRYRNSTVWSGQSTGAGSNAAETYINDGTLDPATAARSLMIDADTTPSLDNALLASKTEVGKNSDIIDNDFNLSTLTEEQLFEAFFAGSINDIREKAKAAGQYYTDIDDAAGKSGLIWVQGTGNLSADVGNYEKTLPSGEIRPDPAFFVIDARDLTAPSLSGNIYGLVFVLGNANLSGSGRIFGALVASRNVDGASTFYVTYDPEGLKEPPGGDKNARGIVAGTWKDWD